MTGSSEGSIIRILRDKLGICGPLEDVESYRFGSRRFVIATDTLVESTDMPPGMRLADAARKSVAACVSDFVVKGVRPRFGTISVVLPRGMPKRGVAEIGTGLKSASTEFGIKILGGDVSEGAEIAITATLCGVAGRMPARRGAGTGDGIFVTGNFGHAAAGLHLMLASRAGRARYAKAFARPRPGIEFGVRAGRYLSSSMDSSDGLARTLNEMARQGRRRFQITNMPQDRGLEWVAGDLGISASEMILYGGEEYEMVFTVPQSRIRRVTGIAERCGTKLTHIGVVEGGSGVFLPDGSKVEDRGWSHFG